MLSNRQVFDKYLVVIGVGRVGEYIVILKVIIKEKQLKIIG